ncbi:MAG: CPBP family intramembrane glutamic endopeptidase [Armatimonadota bacterium]
MDSQSGPRGNAGRFWGVLAVLLIVGIALVALQVADMSAGKPEKLVPQDRTVSSLADSNLLRALISAMIVAGFVGLVLAMRFLINYSDYLKNAPSPGVSSSVLIRAFLVYLVGSFVFEAVVVASMTLSGIDSAGDAGDLVYLVLQALAILAAFALGIAALWLMTGYSEEGYRRIGLLTIQPRVALKWGFGGYLAALPFLGAAVAMTQLLDRTIFRNLHTPEHPLVPYFMGGGASSFVVVFILGAVIAPLAEETFFRGVLYGALRDGMGVWGAAVISAIIFALGHPIPAYFLPILVLGVVFALVREKTGSLVPSMIAHSIHNSVAMILARLLY